MKDVLTQLLENLEKTPETARTETTRTETARTEVSSNRPGGILDELNDDSFASISDENSDDAENVDGANLKTETCEICGKVSFIVFSSVVIVDIQFFKFKSGQLEVILNHYVHHAVTEYLKLKIAENHSVAEIEAILEAEFDDYSAFIYQVA